jgi:hypothetical protein
MDIRTLMPLLAASATLLVAPLAAADDDYAYAPRTHYVTARVEQVEPIYRMVRISEPRRECWDERYVESVPTHRNYGNRYGHGNHYGNRYRYDDRRYYDDRGSTAGGNALIGAIIGGVIGHQFGDGNGRDAATVAGALIGASAAHGRAVDRSGPRTYVDQHRTRTRCSDRYDERQEQRLTGYRVTYYHDGQRYVTRMDRDPGSTVRVAVSARVVGD